MLSTLTDFDRTTALRPDADRPHRFLAALDESWASLRGVHGGYVTALAVRAAEATVSDRAVRTVAATFLRPTHPGPAVLDVATLRYGRSLSTVQVTARQDDRDVASTRVTMTDPSIAGHEWMSVPPDRPIARDRCGAFTPPPSIRHFE